MPQLTDEQWEAMGLAIDSLDGFVTGLVCMTTLPDRIHVQALRKGLPEVRETMRRIWNEIEDVSDV